MKNNYPCEIIRDLLPGYIDQMLSDTGMEAVESHVKSCGECETILKEMKQGSDMEEQEEAMVLNGFKKIQQRTRRLKAAVLIISIFLGMGICSAFLFLFVIGNPVPTHQVELLDINYEEDTGSLTIKGELRDTDHAIGRVIWEESEEDVNTINVIVYEVEPLPFRQKQDFSITIPYAKGRKVNLACPDYDRIHLYSWKDMHYEQLNQLEKEIYQRMPELNREKDILCYNGGVYEADGTEWINYLVETVVGEGASFWTFNDTIITDGELESSDYTIWVTLEEPYRVLISDYSGTLTEAETGKELNLIFEALE